MREADSQHHDRSCQSQILKAASHKLSNDVNKTESLNSFVQFADTDGAIKCHRYIDIVSDKWLTGSSFASPATKGC